MRDRARAHQPFPRPAPVGAAADLQERFAAVEERSGFLPNVFAALSWRPDEAAPSSPCTTP